jgi:hypothetical protein
MERYETIGSGTHASWPYQVAVHWDDSLPARPRYAPLAICLSEGTGHGAQGGNFALADLLNETWSKHLEICGCLWLRDLAQQERGQGRCFSADEIFAAAQARRGVT